MVSENIYGSIDEFEAEFKYHGYDCEQIIPGVLLVKNFLTEQDIVDLWEIINSTTEDGWRKEYLENLVRFCELKFGRSDVDNLVKEGKFEITLGWDDKIIAVHQLEVAKRLTAKIQQVMRRWPDLNIQGWGTVQRQQPGVPLKKHTDVHTDPSIVYASICYINDDYNDGEIFWAKKDFKMTPKSRSLVIFSGEEEFEHGVRAVGEGPIRYVLPGFIHKHDFYKKNKF